MTFVNPCTGRGVFQRVFISLQVCGSFYVDRRLYICLCQDDLVDFHYVTNCATAL